MIHLNKTSCNDLRWWVAKVKSNPGRSFNFQQTRAVVTTVASELAWGAVVSVNLEVVRGIFEPAVSTGSINFKELLAVKLAMTYFSERYSWRDCSIKMCSANSTALANGRHFGDIKAEAMDYIAAEIYAHCESKQIRSEMEHIPGVDNVRAHFLSRSFNDTIEWSIS